MSLAGKNGPLVAKWRGWREAQAGDHEAGIAGLLPWTVWKFSMWNTESGSP